MVRLPDSFGMEILSFDRVLDEEPLLSDHFGILAEIHLRAIE